MMANYAPGRTTQCPLSPDRLPVRTELTWFGDFDHPGKMAYERGRSQPGSSKPSPNERRSRAATYNTEPIHTQPGKGPNRQKRRSNQVKNAGFIEIK
ncbi:unnamed protein product [Protopolystoma xenopodis]|uniref:Uncharacterized protein n=1 Tax=Protopolystoma xenopodis TaxID=117903 RepID=A0A3S5BXJ8_9PLAT|nr:unnamed protein product [Protopolystoma xenopodis]